MASVTWDKNLLAAKIASLHGLEASAFKTTLAQLIAAGGVKLTMDTFRKQADPYGQAWKPLKRERTKDRRARIRREAKGLKARGQKILVKSSRMKNSTTAIQTGSSGGVAIPVGYSAAHQKGTRFLPQRMMLPSAERGLPLPWRKMTERETLGLIKRVLNPGVQP